ncbi:hypothetical protein EGW08_001462, partial [Elysia chlorotica]
TNHSYTWLNNYLHLELQSTSRGGSKGFWIYYEAYPPLATTIEAPDTSNREDSSIDVDIPRGSNDWELSQPHQTDSMKLAGDSRAQTGDQNGESTPGKGGNPGSTVPLYRDDNKDSGKKLPFAAIAGGVIGTLSLILLVLLLLLFIKWCKERRYHKAEKILEIRNPAFRSSNDFHDTQGHAGYYC